MFNAYFKGSFNSDFAAFCAICAPAFVLMGNFPLLATIVPVTATVAPAARIPYF